MAVYENSRYINSPLYIRDGSDTPTLKIRDRHVFNLDNATTHVWKASDTLDGVAYKYYEVTDLRWAILDANPQYRTEFDIKVGDTIFIPDFEEVVELING